MPRGIDNNNPGNIEYGPFAIAHGATGSDGRFAIFPSVEQGISAITALQNVYENKYGLESVNDRIGRWAPAGENNVNAYANAVAKAMGISPSQPFSFSDPAMAQAFIAAMIQHENGMQPYSAQTIAKGYGAYTGRGTSAAAALGSGAASPSLSRDEVSAIQQALNARGANLVVDGIWGKNTQAAFNALGQGLPQSSQGGGGSDLFSGLSPSEIANLQATINASMPGANLAVDGIAGPLTRAAFDQFQSYLGQGGSWATPNSGSGNAAAALGQGSSSTSGPSSNAAINSQLGQWWSSPIPWTDSQGNVHYSTLPQIGSNVSAALGRNAQAAQSGAGLSLGDKIGALFGVNKGVNAATAMAPHVMAIGSNLGRVASAIGSGLGAVAKTAGTATGLNDKLAQALGRALTVPEARLVAAQTAIGRTVGVNDGQLTIGGGGPSWADIAPGGSNTGYTGNPTALAVTGYSVGAGPTPYDGLNPYEYGFSTQGYR